MVLKDVQEASPSTVARQKAIRDERLAEEGRDRKGMDVFATLAKNLSNKILTDHYTGVDQQRKFEIEKEKLDYSANIEAAQAREKQKREVQKETRKLRVQYGQDFAKASSSLNRVKAESVEKAMAVLMKHASSTSGGTQKTFGGGVDLDKLIATKTQDVQRLFKKHGEGSTLYQNARDALAQLQEDALLGEGFMNSAEMEKIRTQFAQSGLSNARKREILGNSGLLEKWIEHQTKFYHGQVRLARALFKSVEQGTDRVTLPEFIDGEVRAREGNQGDDTRDWENNAMDEVVVGSDPNLVNGDDAGVVTGPTGSTRSGLTKKKKRIRKVTPTTDPTNIIEETEEEPLPEGIAERRAAITRQLAETNHLYANFETPGQLLTTETKKKKPYTRLQKLEKVRSFVDTVVGNDRRSSTAVRYNYSLAGLGAPFDAEQIKVRGVANKGYQEKLKSIRDAATKKYTAGSQFRSGILEMRKQDLVSGIFNNVINRDGFLKQLKGAFSPKYTVQMISEYLRREGVDPQFNVANTDPAYQTALKEVATALKKPENEISPNEVAAHIFYKSILGTKDLNDLRKALTTKPTTSVLVEGEQVTIFDHRGQGTAEHLDLLNPTHARRVVEAELAGYLKETEQGVAASRAVALGRINPRKNPRGQAPLGTHGQVAGLYKQALNNAMTHEGVTAAFQELLSEIGSDGKVSVGQWRGFKSRLRIALAARLEDSGAWNALVRLGRPE